MYICSTKPQQYKSFMNLTDNSQTNIVLTNQEIVPANFYFANIIATLLQTILLLLIRHPLRIH